MLLVFLVILCIICLCCGVVFFVILPATIKAFYVVSLGAKKELSGSEKSDWQNFTNSIGETFGRTMKAALAILTRYNESKYPNRSDNFVLFVCTYNSFHSINFDFHTNSCLLKMTRFCRTLIFPREFFEKNLAKLAHFFIPVSFANFLQRFIKNISKIVGTLNKLSVFELS